MSANIKTVTDASWEKDVLQVQGETLILVDFWAEWCGPCRKIAPVLEEIAGEMNGKVTIAKLNIDENPKVTRDYRIMSIPTLTLFKGGEPVQSILGAHPKSTIVKMIESVR